MWKHLPLASVAAAASFVAPVANADLVTYTDRTMWETAAGGSPSINVNFDSYGTDTALPEDVGPFTIEVFGGSGGSRIDAPPLELDVNGTTNLRMFFNADTDQGVTLTFDTLVFSWGADVRFDVPGGVTVTAGHDMMVTLPQTATQAAEFRGFVSDTPFTDLTFKAFFQITTGTFQAGVDNVSAHAIPEPPSFLFAMLAGSCCWLGRRWLGC